MSNLILQYSIINGIILLLILWHKKKSFAAAKYFLLVYVAYILVVTEQLCISYLVYKTTWYAYCELPIHFVFSPLTYLYVATYLDPAYKPGKKKLLLLFLPCIIDILCFTSLCFYVSVNHFTIQQKAVLANDQTFYLIRTGMASAYSLYLTVAILLLIKNYFQNVKKVYADTSKLKIKWLQSISIISIFFWVLCFGYFIAEIFYKLPREYYVPLFLMLSLLIIVQGYFVVLKPDMVFEFTIINKEINESKKDELLEKISDEILNTDHLEALFKRIDLYMHEEKAYANNNLSLSVIADHLNDSTAMVTKAIRHGYNDSFYNYVNRLRARKFLEELPKAENDIFTLETLSTKCGFNSKATLHKYFKELTGLTPAIAQKKLKSGEATISSILLL